MSDEFLYEAGPPLREEFAEGLYETLCQSGRGLVALPWWFGFNRRTIAYVFSAVLVAVIAVACARELIKQRYVQVGDMWVLEGSPVTVQRFRFFEGPENALSLPPTAIPVAEAVEMLPYEFRLPEWVPQGYSLVHEEVAPPNYPGWTLDLSWANDRGDYFLLWIQVWDVEIRAPAGMWTEMEVNGLPAVLIRGRFPFPPPPTPGVEVIEREVRWDQDAGLTLVWKQGGARFQLTTFGTYLTGEDLVWVAESMRGP